MCSSWLVIVKYLWFAPNKGMNCFSVSSAIWIIVRAEVRQENCRFDWNIDDCKSLGIFLLFRSDIFLLRRQGKMPVSLWHPFSLIYNLNYKIYLNFIINYNYRIITLPLYIKQIKWKTMRKLYWEVKNIQYQW